MRVSVDWLREYVAVTDGPRELARRLTNVGLAVEAINDLDRGVRGVVVGRVEAMARHPNAENLWVCQVDVGAGDQLQVVTGAGNVRAGDLVPVAVPGATVAGGQELGVASFRGVQSQGMLCSPEELGIPEGGDTILILPPDAPVGGDCARLLGLDDIVLELELTTNYAAHAQSVIGVAQEYAALTGQAVNWPAPAVPEAGPRTVHDYLACRIDAPDLCPRYCGRVIEGVQVGPSPLWLQKRVRAAGMRPINNIVDITNFVMMELGQPLHAFDYRKLAGPAIIIRRAGDGETIVGLDGVTRTLDPEVLVIADAEKPQVIAGIFGGEDSEVDPGTTTVFLEAAWFHNINNRRTARRYNLPSEASARFTKGVDPSGLVRALDRAAQLMAELAGGRVVPGVIDLYPGPYAPRVVPARLARLRTVMGLDVTREQAITLLQRLGFGALPAEAVAADPEGGPLWPAVLAVSPVPADPAARAGWEREARAQVRAAAAQLARWATTPAAGDAPVRIARGAPGDALVAVVPTRRLDVAIEDDLAEEVAREYGYDRVEATLPVGPAVRGSRTPEQEAMIAARRLLAGAGLDEVVAYSLVHPRVYDRLRLPEGDAHRKVMTIQNPLYDERSTLRTLLAGSALDVLQYNVNRQVRDLQIFEIGKVYQVRPSDTPAYEEWRISIAGTGNAHQKGWDTPARPVDFYWLKGVVEHLLAGLGIAEVGFRPGGPPYLHPGRRAVVQAAGRHAGVIGEVDPRVQAAWDLPGRVYLAELEFPVLLDAIRTLRPYRPVPRFPAVVRDVAFILGQEVPAATLQAAIAAAGGDLVEEVRLFDLYQGAPVPEGRRSLAYSVTYRAADRTLTDAEVEAAHARVRSALAELGAELRS